MNYFLGTDDIQVYISICFPGELRGSQVFWQAVALLCFICSVLYNADNTVLCEKS